MYKKFALVVLLLAPVLTMIASSFTAKVSTKTQTLPIVAEQSAMITSQYINPNARIVMREEDNASNAASELQAGMPVLDPKGIDPVPALALGEPPVQDQTPNAPPSISPHDRPVAAQPQGL